MPLFNFPPVKKFETILMITDIHYPNHDEKVLEMFLEFCRDSDPDHIVYLGDCFDADGISKYTKKTVEKGLYETLEEIRGFRDNYHARIKEAAPNAKFKWTLGNHDGQRIKEAIQAMPERKELINIREMFPEIEFCEYNESLRLGKLSFTHGIYHCDAHAKKHVSVYGTNVVYGHLHCVQSYTNTTFGDGNSHMGMSLPCACNMNPAYMKNRPNSWLQGFGYAYMFPDGTFNLYPVIINKKGAIINGKIYS